MDFMSATIKSATEAVSASFRQCYYFCGNQGFEYPYHHLKTHACDFFFIYSQVELGYRYNLADVFY